MVKDPYEMKNLRKLNGPEIEELKKEMVEYLKWTDDPVYEIVKND